jgi:voltage-gated potassium channel
MDPVRKFRLSLLTLFSVVCGGTFGYSLIEDWSLFESLYMTIITVATVGFKEIHELSHGGKIFTILLIIFGASSLAYTLGSLFQFMVEGQLRSIMGRKKLEKKISALTDHYIVCGYGRIGRLICREFAAKPASFIVIEEDTAICQQLEDSGYLYVHGDSTRDEILLQAGIRQAKGLITAVTSDSANVYITLSARGLNPDLFILARASEEGSEIKLKRAGANKVVSPYTIGASRMAHAMLRPSVVDFIEIATGDQDIELQLEEIRVAPDSQLAGTTLLSSDIRKKHGIIIVGIRKDGQKIQFNPGSDTAIDTGDTLITLGELTAIKELEQIAMGGYSAL